MDENNAVRMVLTSSDEEEFAVELDVAKQSGLVKGMIETLGLKDEPIPLPFTSPILKKVLEYCEHYRDRNVNYEDTNNGLQHQKSQIHTFNDWDTQFIQMDPLELAQLNKAAHYMNIPGLLQLGSKAVGNMLIGKSPEQIRVMFNLQITEPHSNV